MKYCFQHAFDAVNIKSHWSPPSTRLTPQSCTRHVFHPKQNRVFHGSELDVETLWSMAFAVNHLQTPACPVRREPAARLPWFVVETWLASPVLVRSAPRHRRPKLPNTGFQIVRSIRLATMDLVDTFYPIHPHGTVPATQGSTSGACHSYRPSPTLPVP